MSAFPRRASGCLLAVAFCAAIPSSASARPSYGIANCVICHSSSGFGIDATNRLVDVVSGTTATIPSGAHGDPDRGEGPLSTYTASPGGSFNLQVQVKDPNPGTPPFQPEHYAVGLKHFFTTDPDYQNGNPNTADWADNMLTLSGATYYDDLNPPTVPDPEPIPLDETGWWIHTDVNSGGPLVGSLYYTSVAENGHWWYDPDTGGPHLFSLTVTVPAGVVPGWYDLEVSVEGDQKTGDVFAYYDEEHFYLHILPEPASAMLLLAGLLAARRRR
ncbi:MAG: hypothetical protein U1A27_12580 [Phycisphaerae bacterium]